MYTVKFLSIILVRIAKVKYFLRFVYYRITTKNYSSCFLNDCPRKDAEKRIQLF